LDLDIFSGKWELSVFEASLNDSYLATNLSGIVLIRHWGQVHAGYAAPPRILYRERTSSSTEQETKYLTLCVGNGLRLPDVANTGSLVTKANY